MKVSKHLPLLVTALALGLNFTQAQEAPAAAETPKPEEAKTEVKPEAAKPASKPDAPKPEERRAAMLNNMVDQFFGNADKDSDGKISREEYANHAQKDIERRFKAVDTNEDGVIEKSELQSSLEKQINNRRPDAQGRGQGGPRGDGFRRPEGGPRPDGDGFRRPSPRDGDGPRGEGGRGQRGERGPRGGFGSQLQNMDTNNDGIISKEEYLKGSEEAFKNFDADGDGKFSLEELRSRFNGSGPRRDNGQ